MMSKIKSRKIANVKILVGIVLAVSLIAVFACEKKESAKTEIPSAGKSITIVADGKPLQITGDPAGIEKLKSVIISSGQFELKSDTVTGELTIVKQEEVYSVVEQMPEFQGGQTELGRFLGKSVKYPPEAVKKGIQGKVFVTFVVGKDGSVSNAKIARGVDPLLDSEALRVVNTMPKWTPGKQSGKEVAVQFTVPINFKLQ